MGTIARNSLGKMSPYSRQILFVITTWTQRRGRLKAVAGLGPEQRY